MTRPPAKTTRTVTKRETKPATKPARTKAKNATVATAGSVDAFLATVGDAQTRADASKLRALFESAVGAPGKMWGKAIVGFGARKLIYESGRELDWFVAGFAPRKGKLTLYLGLGDGALDADVAALGKCTTGKGCLYVRALADVDGRALEKLIRKVAARRP